MNDDKLFEINSVKMLFALPINSFALVNSSENIIYLVKITGSNKNLFNKVHISSPWKEEESSCNV